MDTQKTPAVKGITIHGKELKKLFEYLYPIMEGAHKELKEDKKHRPNLEKAIILENALFYSLDIRTEYNEYARARREAESTTH